MIDFLAANWLWIVLIGAFLWMHSRGGGCGMHGNHRHGGQDGSSHDESARESRGHVPTGRPMTEEQAGRRGVHEHVG